MLKVYHERTKNFIFCAKFTILKGIILQEKILRLHEIHQTSVNFLRQILRIEKYLLYQTFFSSRDLCRFLKPLQTEHTFVFNYVFILEVKILTFTTELFLFRILIIIGNMQTVKNFIFLVVILLLKEIVQKIFYCKLVFFESSSSHITFVILFSKSLPPVSFTKK